MVITVLITSDFIAIVIITSVIKTGVVITSDFIVIDVAPICYLMLYFESNNSLKKRQIKDESKFQTLRCLMDFNELWFK